jgi:glycogen debranching enzyme
VRRRVRAPRTTYTLLLVTCLTRSVVAQDSAVPRFPIATSPIEIVGDVRPQQYLGVQGRQAAWLGTETGAAELWVHPLKLASDFQLDFRIPDYTDPVRGVDVARTVTVRPELTTITYSHATFTVREHILGPLDVPGLLVLLEVETFRPLEIIVSFRTVFQYAWPAGFGGQYTVWSEDDKAFLLSESLRRRSAFIGSPWAAAASSHPAHALPDAPSVFTIPVDSARASREFIPIAIAAGEAPRDSVRSRYRRLLTDARGLYEARRRHVDDLLAQSTTLDTPDDDFDRAFAWGLVNLDEQMVCNPDLGCGLVAGWGPSGRSTRPGFGWFFGGDAAINSLAMDAAGLWPQVATGLRFLATYQRADGKIPHEISQAAARIPWFTEFPYTYYHLDTTPYWIMALWRYWLASGDGALLDELWPNLERAYRWSVTRDTDGDGLIENGPENLGAIEVGALGEGLHEDIYVAAIWIEALKAVDDLARATGNAELAQDAAHRYQLARTTVNERLWREHEGHHAFGLLTSGQTNDNLTVWPATPAAFGQLDAERARRTLTKLATDSISADWGAHFLSTGSPLYDPMGYNGGAIWPFVTGFVILGQYRYHRPWAGFPLLDALGQMTFDFARGRLPELLSGAYYRPLDTAVPQQFFATSMLVNPLVSGLLGWEPDAPRNRARLAPQLPPHWVQVWVNRLKVGAASVEAAFTRLPQMLAVGLRATGGTPTVTLELPLPPGARSVEILVDSVPAKAERVEQAGALRVRLDVALGPTRRQVTVTWEGGLDVGPEPVALSPGQSSTGVRILDFTARGDGWDLLVEGTRGRSYPIRLYGPLPGSVTGGTLEPRAGFYHVVNVTFPEGTGRATARVRLER